MQLSILIPARNEAYLSHTVRDLLRNIRGDTEIIVVLDGAPALDALPDDPRVRVIEYREPIGQRAACNAAARASQSAWLMKVDAHCAFAEGFDVTMLQDANERTTYVPNMRNLHVFDWVCANGHRRYQSRSGVCETCGGETHQEIVWYAKRSPNSTSFTFDPTPHFQYFGDFKKRPAGQGPLSETMSLQGSCFMLTQERWWALDICDEAFGSWGSQGIEVACKTWLSGGRVIANHRTWYAHAFRTQGGDWGFPYPLAQSQVEHAKSRARELFLEGKWDKAVYPMAWLVERFWPIPYWTLEDLRQLKASSPTPA